MEPESDTTEAQASTWVVRNDAGLTPEERRALDAWLAADRRHHGAYIRAQAAWHDADRIAAMAGGRQERIKRSFTFGRARSMAAAIAALTVICATAWFATSRDGKTYASEIGEMRNIELSDGSELILNTNTRATVQFKENQRKIALERGEALFKVARDPSRPFVVRANNVVIRAIGTAFTVRVDDTRTDIVVTEGTVDVSRIDASGSNTIQRVTANHRMMLASAESRPDVEAIAPEVLERELAWRDGMVAFDGEPLSVAVAEINRYSRRRIYIDDPDLAARPVLGIFHANDAEAFASAAAATFGAEIDRSNGEIHLRMGALAN